MKNIKMWCYRRMEKISWTDRVRSEESLCRVKVLGNSLYTITSRKEYWIDHIMPRNCLQKQVIEGKIEGKWEVAGRRRIRIRSRRRHKQLLDKFKETRAY
jgi:hypothetical protein